MKRKLLAALIFSVVILVAKEGFCEKYISGEVSPDGKKEAIEMSLKLGLENFVPMIEIFDGKTGKNLHTRFVLEGEDGRKIEKGTKIAWSGDSKQIAVVVIEQKDKKSTPVYFPAVYNTVTGKNEPSYPIASRKGTIESLSFSGSKLTAVFLSYIEWGDAEKACGTKPGYNMTVQEIRVKVTKDISKPKSKEVVSRESKCNWYPIGE